LMYYRSKKFDGMDLHIFYTIGRELASYFKKDIYLKK